MTSVAHILKEPYLFSLRWAGEFDTGLRLVSMFRVFLDFLTP